MGAWHYHRRILRLFSWSYLWHPPTLVRYFHVGKYLLIRTLTLQTVTLFFIRAGGMIGVTTLAANSLLMQLFTLFSYFMDGIAYAAEALVGEAIGAQDRARLRRIIPAVLRIGGGLAVVGAVLYAFVPEPFLALLTDKAEVLGRALEFRYWMALVPLVSFAAFLWDGILVGATDSRTMGLSMLAAGGAFFVVYLAVIGPLGAHGLWVAFLSYLGVRSALVWTLGRRHCRG